MSASTNTINTVSRGIEPVDGSRSLNIEVQYIVDTLDSEKPPCVVFMQDVAQLAYSFELSDQTKPQAYKELTVRIVDSLEMRELNKQFRGKDKPTNVLSFEFDQEFDPQPDAETSLLGDIVLCHSVIVDEAIQQEKSLANHYAHMVVHGVLHLRGFDHQDEAEAASMESLEIAILAKCGIADPY